MDPPDLWGHPHDRQKAWYVATSFVTTSVGTYGVNGEKTSVMAARNSALMLQRRAATLFLIIAHRLLWCSQVGTGWRPWKMWWRCCRKTDSLTVKVKWTGAPSSWNHNDLSVSRIWYTILPRNFEIRITTDSSVEELCDSDMTGSSTCQLLSMLGGLPTHSCIGDTVRPQNISRWADAVKCTFVW